MLTRSFCAVKLPARKLSGNAAANTEVVLLHFGQPWTEFYAKEYLLKRAALFYNVPSILERFIPKNLLTNDTVRGCISKYGDVPSLETQVDKLAEQLEESLKTVVPEYGPIKVSRIFQFDQLSIAEQFEQLKLSRSKKFVFVPLYPHFYGGDSGVLLAEIGQHIGNTTVPFIENNKEVRNSRIEQKSDYSFDVSTVHRWNDHPIVSDYWSAKLKPELPKLDGIVFVAPRKFCYSRQEYDRSVWATCERTMTRLAHSVPWRLAFYNSWDSWDLPVRTSISSQVKQFGDRLESKKIAIVPITDILETFDTIHVLPKLVENLRNAVLLKPDTESDKLTQGLAEILKNHLLGRPHRQLELMDNHFMRKDNEHCRIFY